MRIAEKKFYNGSERRIARLGIVMFEERISLLEELPLFISEEKDSNSGAAVRRMIDDRFAASQGWTKTVSGGIDWKKCITTNASTICLGVEIQVSARSDLVVIDVMHLRDALESGLIDVGVIVVPSDKMAYFMTDRAPTFRETLIAIETRLKTTHSALVVLAIEHDGPGAALAKRIKA
jgi:hypothetical protein